MCYILRYSIQVEFAPISHHPTVQCSVVTPKVTTDIEEIDIARSTRSFKIGKANPASCGVKRTTSCMARSNQAFES